MIPHAFDKKDDEVSIVTADDYEKAKKVKWYYKILLNRPLKVIIALLLVSVLAPTLIYQFALYGTSERAPSDGFSTGSCFNPRESRIPCGPANVTQSECHASCCYDLQNYICYHRLPSRFTYIFPQAEDWIEETEMRARQSDVPFNFQPSVSVIRLSIDEITSSHLSFTFYDSEIMSLNGRRIENKDYSYEIQAPELNIVVNANRTDPIFSTMRGPIIASDNIWEMAFKLTDEAMYGLEELPLKPGTVKVIHSHDGGVSSIPLIFAKKNDSYHGLLFDIKAPTEVIIKDDYQILIRSITKMGLKLHLFTGPTPKDIMRDVMQAIGSPPEIDYWMLGAHVCSEVSATDAEALTHLTTFITNAAARGFRYESHCGIRPLVFGADELVTTPVEQGATAVRNVARRFVPHISPYIRYIEEEIEADDSTEHNETISCSNIVCEYKDIMLRLPYNDSVLYTGIAHDHSVVYPDYSSENGTDLLDRLWQYNVVLNGLLIENNWPLDESPKAHNETYQDLPYFSQSFEEAFNRIPQWNARRPQGDYYIYEHNEYGSHFMDALWRKFNQTPSVPTWSSSQWMRADAIVNRQNVQTSWFSLGRELVAAALGGVSGQWLWSTPICGDTENFNLTTHVHLCVKWYMAGTYLPMIKIHSKSVSRDPTAFEGTHQNIVLNAITQRMALMPYFHTVLQEGPLLRPMFYQYPFSEQLVNLSSQFNVGDDLLIVPNMLPSQSHVHVWLPPGSWYEFWGGLRIDAEEEQVISLTTTEADFVTLIRGGSIVPVQRTPQTTADLTRRNSDFALVVATDRLYISKSIEEAPVETDYAAGYLHMSSNMTVHFKVQENQLTITSEGDDFDSFCGDQAVWASTVRVVDIYGLPEELNNMDNYKNVNIPAGIDLCSLRTQDIVFALV